MGQSYSKIFKQALSFTKTHKFLWALGLFLIWGNMLVYWIIVSTQQKGPGYTDNSEAIAKQLTVEPQTAAALGILFLIIGLLVFLMYFKSRSVLAVAVKDLVDHKPVLFWKSFKNSKVFLARQLGLWVLLAGSLLISAVVVMAPVGYLWSMNFTYRAGILGTIGLVIIIPIAFLVALLNIFSGLFIVLLNFKVGDSIKASFDLIVKFWWSLVNMVLSMLCLSFLAMLGILFIQALVLVPFVILAGLSYDMVGLHVDSPYVITGITLGIIIFFWLVAVLSSFQHVVCTLVFLDLVKPKKVEEEVEVAVVPEVV